MEVAAYFFVDKGVFDSPSHAKEFITRAESLDVISEIDYEFVIEKRNLGRYMVGNFWYNHHYQYDFKTKLGKAYRLKCGGVECVEVSIRQLMSDYADDRGSTKIKFRAGNVANEVIIDGGLCTTPDFIGAIIDFMKELDQDYAANWKFYSKVKELEKTNRELAEQVSDLEKKLSKPKV
jgi:hypothetical protein